MMQDLRGRVMDLLDDPSLEAVKVRSDHMQNTTHSLYYVHKTSHSLFYWDTCNAFRFLLLFHSKALNRTCVIESEKICMCVFACVCKSNREFSVITNKR